MLALAFLAGLFAGFSIACLVAIMRREGDCERCRSRMLDEVKV